MSAVNTETFERIKHQLRTAKDTGSTVKQDLYSHLTEVFNRIMLHHPYDAYDKFEEISALVKQTHLKIKDPMFDHELNKLQDGNASNAQRAEWILKSKNLICEINDMVNGDCKKMLTKNKTFAIPNFFDEADMLEWAGISFGEEETYKLQKSIKRLAIMSGADRLRFFGKIYGTKQDYLIAVGTLNEAEEVQADRSVEKRGEGVNKMVFWVTNNLLNDWVQLPDCKPHHLQMSRLIKHVFTGDLNANVDCNPPFPGKERHLLRAQLARIQHATVIVPKGQFEIDEETQEMKPAEEFAMPSTEELKSLEAWGHLFPIILKAGRTTHLEPEGLGEEEAAEAKAALEESDKTEERFRALNEDSPMPGLETAWLSRVVGDTQQYNTAAGGTQTYAVNVIKSLRWPGAVTVSKGGVYTSVYVGYGIKKGDSSYFPTEPPMVQQDPLDQSEMPEPTPLQAPEEPPEPDTDAEKNKEEGEEEDE